MQTKLLKLFESIISERKQVGDVYHFTSSRSLFQILQTNRLKPTWGTRNFSMGKMTGFTRSISTTRDKNFSKYRLGTKSQIKGDDFVLVIDGTRMSDKYRTIAYDDSYDPSDYEEENRDLRKIFGDEMEQLWYGPKIEKDGITNIKDYIKKIIITKKFQKDLVNFNYDDSMFDREFTDKYKKNWEYSTSPRDKFLQIQEFIKDKYNIDVELEK